MKKTEAYDLNLIDMDDTFSPEPINENTQKLEAALAGTEDRLAQRLSALEARKLVAGSYIGTSNGTTATPLTQTIELGFTPLAVIIRVATTSSPFAAVAVDGSPVMSGTSTIIQVVPGGFTVSGDYNRLKSTFNYVAIL